MIRGLAANDNRINAQRGGESNELDEPAFRLRLKMNLQ